MTAPQLGKFFYGPEEFGADWTSLGQGINYFPEYRLDIGSPITTDQQLDPYVWLRTFSKGVVVVNADPTKNYTYTVKKNSSKVIISSEYLKLDSLKQKVTDASFGEVKYQTVQSGTEIVLPAASALILLDN
jgi:hypothetical protein